MTPVLLLSFPHVCVFVLACGRKVWAVDSIGAQVYNSFPTLNVLSDGARKVSYSLTFVTLVLLVWTASGSPECVSAGGCDLAGWTDGWDRGGEYGW